RRDLLRARGRAPLGSIGHHRGGGRLGMLRVKARAYARPLRGFGLDPSAFPVFVACHHVGGDRRRSAQKSELPAWLDKKRPIQGTSRAALRRTRGGRSAPRGSLLFATGTTLNQRPRGVTIGRRSGVKLQRRLTATIP